MHWYHEEGTNLALLASTFDRLARLIAFQQPSKDHGRY